MVYLATWESRITCAYVTSEGEAVQVGIPSYREDIFLRFLEATNKPPPIVPELTLTHYCPFCGDSLMQRVSPRTYHDDIMEPGRFCWLTAANQIKLQRSGTLYAPIRSS